MNLFRRLLLRPPDLTGMKLGEAGEAWVAYLYRRRGHRVLHRNFKVIDGKVLGELDIICSQGRRITIVEVKTRADERFMPIEQTIHPHKQYLLRRMAAVYLRQNPRFQNYDIQIDIAGVLMDPFDNFVKSVKLIENAIEDTQ